MVALIAYSKLSKKIAYSGLQFYICIGLEDYDTLLLSNERPWTAALAQPHVCAGRKTIAYSKI